MNQIYYEKDLNPELDRYNEIYWSLFDRGYRARKLRVSVAKIYKGRL
jgi:hypothetical protein